MARHGLPRHTWEHSDLAAVGLIFYFAYGFRTASHRSQQCDQSKQRFGSCCIRRKAQ